MICADPCAKAAPPSSMLPTAMVMSFFIGGYSECRLAPRTHLSIQTFLSGASAGRCERSLFPAALRLRSANPAFLFGRALLHRQVKRHPATNRRNPQFATKPCPERFAIGD